LHLVSIAKTPRPVAMRKAPHLEAQLQAMKAALDGKANSRRPLTATWDEYQPTVIVEVPETYRSYKNRVLRSLPQECDPNRFADGEWKGLVRDPADKNFYGYALKTRGKVTLTISFGGMASFVWRRVCATP
jgi:hypothetical protein